MRSSQQRNCVLAVLMLMSALPLNASKTTTASHPIHSISSIRAQDPDDASTLESLREDVASHPNDFVTFETQTAANRFIVEHGVEAHRETEQRIVRRGILGYWRSKTLVVLPSLSSANPR